MVDHSFLNKVLKGAAKYKLQTIVLKEIHSGECVKASTFGFSKKKIFFSLIATPATVTR